MLDFSRAFRVWDELQHPDELVRCDRGLFARLKTLTEEEIEVATEPYLTSDEITGVLQRRDRLVTHVQTRIDELGEDRVLY